MARERETARGTESIEELKRRYESTRAEVDRAREQARKAKRAYDRAVARKRRQEERERRRTWLAAAGDMADYLARCDVSAGSVTMNAYDMVVQKVLPLCRDADGNHPEPPEMPPREGARDGS